MARTREERDYAQGIIDGETQARQQGTTWEDLRLVPVVQGSTAYRAGHRIGYAKVRQMRYQQEQMA